MIRNCRLGKPLRIPKETKREEPVVVEEDVETDIDTTTTTTTANSSDGLIGSPGTEIIMATTNGLGTVATKLDARKGGGESGGRQSLLFSVVETENASANLMDFESSWGLRRQVASGNMIHVGTSAAAAAAAVKSPLPLNPIDYMAMKIEAGAEVSSSVKDESCVETLPRNGGAIVRWMNVVLDPWEENGGSRENSKNMDSSVSWLAHREVLKKRVMGWCGQVGNKLGIEGPVALVHDKLSKDSVAVGQCVEEALRGVETRDTIMRALKSYSAVWLYVSDQIAGELFGWLKNEREKEYVRSLMFSSGSGERKKDNARPRGKLHPSSYPRIVAHLLGMFKVMDMVMVDGCSSDSKCLPKWAPRLFGSSDRGHKVPSVRTSEQAVQLCIGTMLKKSDIKRYLKYFKYSVSYCQAPRCSISMRVENVCTDLRDGMKLCKLAEVLTERCAFSKEARYPCDKRKDRIHNVSVALSCLGFETGDEEANETKKIVDGDRRATMSLLWSSFLVYDLPKLLNVKSIMLEVDLIGSADSTITVEGVVDDAVALYLETQLRSREVRAVILWVYAVCMARKCSITDIFRNLGDRKLALCSILARYGSECIDDVKQEEPEQVFSKLNNMLRVAGGLPDIVCQEELLKKDSELDEKCLICFFSFLCKRTLSLQYEHRAAMIIQRFWRQISHRKVGYARDNLRKWVRASNIIQRNFRAYMFRKGVRESSIKRARLLNSIICIQSLWRGHQQRMVFVSMQNAVVVLQSQWRGYVIRKTFLETRARQALQNQAATVIQTAWRTYAASFSYQETKIAAVRLQRYYKMVHFRRVFLSKRYACSVIQNNVRSYLSLKQAKLDEMSAVVIQSSVRSFIARKEFLTIRKSAITIQKYVRSMIDVHRSRSRLEAACVIQKKFREYQQKKRQMAACRIKTEMKMLAEAMASFATRDQAARRIQIAWFSYQVKLKEIENERMRSIRTHHAGLSIHAACIGYLCRKRFLTMKENSIRIQRAWRYNIMVKNAENKLLELYNKAVMNVRLNKEKDSASVVIQRYWRRYHVCTKHEMSDHFSCIRFRLLTATHAAIASGADNGNTLANRMSRAMKILKQGNGSLPAIDEMRNLYNCLASSNACCYDFLYQGGIQILLKATILCARDPSQRNCVCSALACLSELVLSRKMAEMAARIFVNNGYMDKLAELVFQQREHKEVFDCCNKLLTDLSQCLCVREHSSTDESLGSKLNGVLRMLNNKRIQVSSYLLKLEGNKGSDVCAKQATKSLVILDDQISTVKVVLKAYNIQLDATPSLDPGAKFQLSKGKNTIVRKVLAEINHSNKIH
eukprot:jgi/Picsp_1/4600/NSC_01970-R1_asp (abnormal spindle)- microcephaly associated